MFKNSICNDPKTDEYLYKKVKEVYLDIVYSEMEYFESLSQDDISDSLELIFTESFVRYHYQEAKNIIIDLYNIANDDIIRNTLPPLHTYAMYRLIRNIMDFYSDLGFNYLDEELENYVHKNYDTEWAESILYWFEDIGMILDDFAETYDDQYMFDDYWNYLFKQQIDGAEFYYNKDIEEMLKLMPKDMEYEWIKIKSDENRINRNRPLINKIINFKSLVESTGYKAFDLNNLREEVGRTLLHFYILGHGYREAEMAGGKSDLILPKDKAIIETKIWRDRKRFDTGIKELIAYLKSQNYKTGFYIVFDKTSKNNLIIKGNNNNDIFWIKTEENIDILCVFIKINPISPSKQLN